MLLLKLALRLSFSGDVLFVLTVGRHDLGSPVGAEGSCDKVPQTGGLEQQKFILLQSEGQKSK